MNNYISKYKNYKYKFSKEFYDSKDVIKFFTKSFFFDGEEIYELKSEGYQKGLREVDKLDVEINKMIETSSAFFKRYVE